MTTEINTSETPQETSTENAETSTLDFDAWIATQEQTIQDRYASHTRGLKSALESERSGRKDLEKQIKALSKAQEEGSQTRAELDRIASTLTEQSTRAEFYEEAHRAGVLDLRLAYLAAKDGGLLDNNGKVNIEQLRVAYPQLFASQKQAHPAGHAGNGTGSATPGKTGMNDFIRKMAGR